MRQRNELTCQNDKCRNDNEARKAAGVGRSRTSSWMTMANCSEPTQKRICQGVSTPSSISFDASGSSLAFEDTTSTGFFVQTGTLQLKDNSMTISVAKTIFDQVASFSNVDITCKGTKKQSIATPLADGMQFDALGEIFTEDQRENLVKTLTMPFQTQMNVLAKQLFGIELDFQSFLLRKWKHPMVQVPRQASVTAGALVGIVALEDGVPAPSVASPSLLLKQRIMTQREVAFFRDQGNGNQGDDDGLYYPKSYSFKYDKSNDPDGKKEAQLQLQDMELFKVFMPNLTKPTTMFGPPTFQAGSPTNDSPTMKRGECFVMRGDLAHFFPNPKSTVHYLVLLGNGGSLHNPDRPIAAPDLILKTNKHSLDGAVFELQRQMTQNHVGGSNRTAITSLKRAVKGNFLKYIMVDDNSFAVGESKIKNNTDSMRDIYEELQKNVVSNVKEPRKEVEGFVI